MLDEVRPAVDRPSSSTRARGPRGGAWWRRAVWALVVASAPFAWSVRQAPDVEVEGPARRPSFGAASPGFLGVVTGPAGTDITGVLPSSPAEIAGLRPGDVVAAIDDVAVTGPRHLRSLVGTRRPGDRVRVRITRDGASLEVLVTLGSARSRQ
jgi:S1-C subfamily serine protease